MSGFQFTQFLADGPLRGKIRPDFTPLALRFWTVQRFPSYVIVYDPASSPLRVIRILHGMRDIERTLRE